MGIPGDRARPEPEREALNIAIIGAGGRGAGNLEGVQSENIVALCDVDATKLDAAASRLPNARKLTDFRKLYDHAKDFDAVVVSICEHAHAYATLPALQLGKHVYCEKPLAYNIWETPGHSRGGGQGQGGHADGDPDSRRGDNYRRGRRTYPDERHRTRARGTRVGVAGLGLAERGRGQTGQGHRVRPGTPQR